MMEAVSTLKRRLVYTDYTTQYPEGSHFLTRRENQKPYTEVFDQLNKLLAKEGTAHVSCGKAVCKVK
jgi:hypothetical protein